jgi:TonB family protein
VAVTLALAAVSRVSAHETTRELTSSEHDAFVGVERATLATVFPMGVWDGALASIDAKSLSVSDVKGILAIYETDSGALGSAPRHQGASQNTGVGAGPETPSNTKGSNFGPEIQFDTRGVEFGPWIRRFTAQMKRNWYIPWVAMSEHGHVVVTFNIQKNGVITDVAVQTSSAVDAFNDRARAAIVGSAPTQPLPPEYPATKAFFTVTFYYNESPPSRASRSSSGTVPNALQPDESGSSLLKANAADVERRIGKPSQVDGHRWTYTTSRGVLTVYFDDAQVVIDVQPRSFDLTVFKK